MEFSELKVGDLVRLKESFNFTCTDPNKRRNAPKGSVVLVQELYESRQGNHLVVIESSPTEVVGAKLEGVIRPDKLIPLGKC